MKAKNKRKKEIGTLLSKRKNGNGFFRITKYGKTIKDFTINDLRVLITKAGYRLPKLKKADYEKEKTIRAYKSWLWKICIDKKLI